MGAGKNIKALRDKFDLTQEQLGEMLGVTRESIVRWESDKMAVRDRHIARMVELFGIEPEDIKSESYGLYSQLYDGHHILEGKIKGARPVKGMEMGYVPLRGKVHAGNPVEPDVYEEEQVLAPQFLIDADPDLYACTSEGDCMNRVYPEGCIIFVSPNKPPQNGSVAVVTIDGIDTVMRRMFKTANTLVLSPDSFNSENKDIIITSDDDRTVEFNGKVVWFQSDGEME